MPTSWTLHAEPKCTFYCWSHYFESILIHLESILIHLGSILIYLEFILLHLESNWRGQLAMVFGKLELSCILNLLIDF